jgi:hypothetical protein
VYGVPLNHESKKEDFLFFIFQNVSRVNTVNTDGRPLMLPHIFDLEDGDSMFPFEIRNPILDMLSLDSLSDVTVTVTLQLDVSII